VRTIPVRHDHVLNSETSRGRWEYRSRGGETSRASGVGPRKRKRGAVLGREKPPASKCQPGKKGKMKKGEGGRQRRASRMGPGFPSGWKALGKGKEILSRPTRGKCTGAGGDRGKIMIPRGRACNDRLGVGKRGTVGGKRGFDGMAIRTRVGVADTGGGIPIIFIKEDFATMAACREGGGGEGTKEGDWKRGLTPSRKFVRKLRGKKS